MKNLLLTFSVLLVSLYALPASAQPPVPAPIAITEIMYNPPESGTDTLEFIELYNFGSYLINLQGYSFTMGIEHTFGTTILYPGDYLVVALSSEIFTSAFGVPALQWSAGRLSNTGELIRLTDNNGLTVDEVEYSISSPWPSQANGGGASLTLCNPWADNSIASNWSAATTAAAVNGAGQTLYADPLSGCPQWTGTPIANFYASSNALATGESVVFQDVSVGNPTAWVWSFTGGSPSSSTLQQPPAIYYPMPGSYQVCLTVANGNGSHQHCEPNYITVTTPPNVEIVISEIMYNPPGSDDSLEYIELYNNGADPADLNGYAFTQGINFTFPQITLPANGFLVLAIDAAAMQNTFGVNALEWNSGFLSNSGEPIVLKDAAGIVVDSVYYGISAPWPATPSGMGPSLVLCDPSLDNSLGSNWIAATEEAAVNAQGAFIYGTPGAACGFSAPVAAFVAGQTTIPEDGTVFFQSQALGYVETYEWTFEGGTPPVQAVPNPQVTYTTAGTWQVCLKVSNVYGSDQLCIDDYITVTPNPEAGLVITELMYNPPEASDSLEFIELYNNGAVPVSLNGYQFTSGISHTFGNQTLEPGSFIVLARDTAAILSTFGLQAEKWAEGSLNNSGELIVLVDSLGRVVDSVHYLNQLPWSPEANGNGSSLTLCDPSLDNAVGDHWIPSADLAAQTPGGPVWASPGSPCSYIVPSPDFAVSQTIVPVQGEVTFNDLSGGYVSERQWTFEGGSPPFSTAASQLVSYGSEGVYRVCLRVSNVYGTDSLCREGYITVTSGVDQRLIISEIMYNSPDSNTDSLEFVEIYNNTPVPIDLDGYRFTSGINHTFQSYLLQPGSYFVLARDSAVATRFYGVPFVQWNGGELQNSGESLCLVDNFGVMVDSLTYSPALPWPTLADGQGSSLVLCNVLANNALPESWSRALDTLGQIANGKYVMANPGSGCNLVAPQASFTASNTYLFPGETCHFTDLSAGNPTSWQWHFQGAVPSTSTDQHPTEIQYPVAGIFSVCLKVSNAAGSDSICYQQLVRVTAPGTTRLSISEIMYNPPDVTEDTLEYIEITNTDTTVIDLLGFKITTGVFAEFPHLMVYPGEKVVVARDPLALYSTTGAGALKWRTGEILSNSGETITLTDRTGAVIDSITYSPVAPWPLETNGTGRSITLCNPWLDNNQPSYWIAAYDLAGIKSNGDTLWGTPGYNCGPSAPVVRVGSAATTVPVNEPASYFVIDLAWPSTSWMWFFENGNPDTSFLANPEVTYSSTGKWSVVLMASNEFGASTYYASRYMSVVESQSIDEPTMGISLWPNPSDGLFIITGATDLVEQVTIYNLQGAVVGDYALTNDLRQFNLSNLPAGMYFVRIRMRNASASTLKLIIR